MPARALKATLAIGLALLAGCSGYRYFDRSPTTELGGWTAQGGDVSRSFSGQTELAPPLVEVWRRDDGLCPWGVVASRGVLVFAGLNQLILGLDAATGELLWRWELRDNPNGPPQILGDKVYLSFDLPAYQVWCLDLATGARLWGRAPDEPPRALLAVEDGPWILSNRHLYQLSALEGELLDKIELPGRPLAGPPALWNEEPALLVKGAEGAGLWGPNLDEPLWYEGEPVAGPLIADEGVPVWIDRDGAGRRVDTISGDVISLGRPLSSPPAGLAAADAGVLSLARNGELARWYLDGDAEPQPLLPPGGVTLVPPLITGGYLWISRAENGLDCHALPPASAEPLWTWETDRAVLSTAVVGRLLVVTTAGGETVALAPAGDVPLVDEEPVVEELEGASDGDDGEEDDEEYAPFIDEPGRGSDNDPPADPPAVEVDG